jgi:phospholipase/carboxylesterase
MNDFLTDNKTDVTENNLSLKYLIRAPKVKSSKQKAIILLHGVGSNEKDLFNLADQLPDDFYIIAPGGQFTLSEGRYAWYNVDFSTGKPIINKEQEASSRGVISAFIKEIKQQYKIDELYLGGFSQGAIMSYTVGLMNPKEINGIIAFSGRMPEEIKPLVKVNEALQQLKVFIAHGIQDSTLPIHYSRQAKDYLESLGVQLSYNEYNIGHQINGTVLKDLNEWLSKNSSQ